MKQFLSGWLEDHHLDRAVSIGSLLALPSNILIGLLQEGRAIEPALASCNAFGILTCDS